ncbi:MAG: hypothetical protein KGL39_25390 [Patescibacteria group bacterium]|nr:hypothetical protein [Patescibacteria group bacterium]
MEIANGTLILSPENHLPIYRVTPAEVLILSKLHFKNSNGSPLGDFYIQDGEAQTVDVEARAAQEQEHNLLTGKVTPAKEFVPAVTHKRTNAEEVERLKKKYTGQISVNGQAMTAFAATFGNAAVVKLPETFAELEGISHLFKAQDAPTKSESAAKARRSELVGKLRADICTLAAGLGIKVHSQDTKEEIITAIIEAENKPAEPEKSE